MNSMTGYGRGESSGFGHRFVVEIQSVNRKQAEWVFSFPREFEAWETPLRDLLAKRVSRGRVGLKVQWFSGTDKGGSRSLIHLDLFASLYQEVSELRRHYPDVEENLLFQLLKMPGMIRQGEVSIDLEGLWQVFIGAVENAMGPFLAMRLKEGKHLEKDLVSRIKSLRRFSKQVKTAGPRIKKAYAERLKTRLAQAGLEIGDENEDRFLKEILFFVDRSDISEELTRLESHFQQFEEACRSTEPVGRTLDFLAQEMFREINTIGSKGNDSGVSRAVVGMKTELEKFREQVQNVE